MKLDPYSLRLFVRVVEEGTIMGAAEREHIAPSAVSKRVSELETILNTHLIERSNKGILPTEAGIALLGLARNVLHGLDDIYFQMRDYSSGTRGYVRMYANISAITQFLPAELNLFLAKFPLVEVHLEEKISSTITKSLAESVIDIGIFTSGTHAGEIETFPYRADELVLITPVNHPLAAKDAVSFSDTLEFQYVGLHAGGSMNVTLTNAASRANRPMKIRVQVTSFDALCLMVEAGLGIGILPRISAELFVKALNVRMLTLEDPWANRELVIGVRSYVALPAAARCLVDHLRRPSLDEAF